MTTQLDPGLAPGPTMQPDTWGALVAAMAEAPRVRVIVSWEWRRQAWRPKERDEYRIIAGRVLPSISQARLRASGIDKRTPVTWTADRVIVPLRRGRLSLLALPEVPKDAKRPY